MRKLLFGLPILFIALLLVFLLLRPSGPQQISKPFYVVAKNIQQPALINNQLYFFTGSSFAKLNIATGRSQPLSDYFYTQGSVTIGSWSDNSVLFSTTGTSDSDTFGQVLLRAGHSNSAASWWRYDFASRQLALLDFKSAASCSSINTVGVSLFCFAPYNGSAHETILYGYNLNSHAQKELLHIHSPVSSVSVEGNSLYYLTTELAGSQTLHTYKTITGPETTVYKSTRQLGYVTNGSQALLTESPLSDKANASINSGSSSDTGSATGTQTLRLFTMSTGKSKKITAPGQAGQFTNIGGGLAFTAPGGHFYETIGNKIQVYMIDGQDVSSAWQSNGTTYYLDSKNELFANKQLSVLKSPDSFIEADNVSPNNFYINVISGGENTVYLNNAAKNFVGNASDVANFLSTHGFDPNQFDFNWQILTIADSAGVSSNSVVLN